MSARVYTLYVSIIVPESVDDTVKSVACRHPSLGVMDNKESMPH